MSTPIVSGDEPLDQRAVATAIAFRRTVISLLIIFHLGCLLIWLTNTPQFLQDFKSRYVARYMIFTGCWQNWGMFSPNPSNDDSYIQARITYKDGVTHYWDLPRSRSLGFFASCERERFRKLAENATTDTTNMLWHGIAVYAARQNLRSPLYPPIQVTLIRHRRWIAALGQKKFDPVVTDFYGIPITAKDLQ